MSESPACDARRYTHGGGYLHRELFSRVDCTVHRPQWDWVRFKGLRLVRRCA